MTDSQQRYQQNIEAIRHNRAMEANQGRELDISQQTADIKGREAAVKEREVATKEAMLPYEQSLAQARTSEANWNAFNKGEQSITNIADFFFKPIKDTFNKGIGGVAKMFSTKLG